MGLERLEMYSASRYKKTPLTCAGCQTSPCQGSRYRTENAKLHKLGWTYCHGTVFAPRQYLYENENKGMQRP